MKATKTRLSSQDVINEPVKGASADKLTPYNFDEFVPWMCLLWQSPETVTVTRIYQEEYVKAVIHSRQSSKSVKSIKAPKVDDESFLLESKLKPVISVIDDSVPVKAYYNLQGNLIEVAIVGCPFDINNIIIQVISITIPYHKMLTKLTITKGGLTATVLHEIGKILPQSFLTDICLDDTKVPVLNYPELLKKSSKLINLSLKRCQLGDVCCKKIAASIETGTPGGSLRTLVLSSNMISDEGALALADVLRRNRQLLHLDLSGNIITDKGAMAILNSLMEFPMRCDEINTMKTKRMEYNRRKMAVYDNLVRELIAAKLRADDRTKSRSRSNKSMRSASSKTSKSPTSKKCKAPPSQVKPPDLIETNEEQRHVDYSYPELEQKAREAVGEFLDTFDANHVLLRDRYFYCVGNMFLCSLNLAYNNLEYTSVKKIRSVLEYQSELKKPPGTTGLMRIIFDGNYVPEYCDEYVDIDTFLQKAVLSQLPKATLSFAKKKYGTWNRKSATTINSRLH